MILIQVKGGTAKSPSKDDIDRLMAVKAYHNADRVILIEWKSGAVLRCIDLATDTVHEPGEIFGKVPSAKKIEAVVNLARGD